MATNKILNKISNTDINEIKNLLNNKYYLSAVTYYENNTSLSYDEFCSVVTELGFSVDTIESEIEKSIEEF